ncbi:MAG: AI-2E family transporter [Candidatus Margulisiibacteriota bacterium]
MSNVFGLSPFQRLLIWGIVGVVLVLGLWAIQDVLMPFAVAFVLAYLLTPLVNRLESVVKNRLVAVIILYVTALVLVGSVVMLVTPLATKEVQLLIQNMPQDVSKTEALVTMVQQNFDQHYGWLDRFHLVDEAQQRLQTWILGTIKQIPTFILSLVATISSLLLVPFILFFFLLQRHDMKRQVLAAIPNQYFEITLNLMHRIGTQLGNYLRGIFLESVLVAVLSIAALLMLDVPYALLIGTFAGICNLVPYLGPVSGTLPAVVMVYMNTHSWERMIWVVVAFAVVQLIDNVFIQPVIHSRSINLHPLLILFSVMLGGSLFGFWGMLFALPVAGTINVVIKQVYDEMEYRRKVVLASEYRL